MRAIINRRGSTATEYVLIAALIGAALVVAIQNLGSIVAALHAVVQAMTSAAL